jgi:hypothetical protein
LTVKQEEREQTYHISRHAILSKGLKDMKAGGPLSLSLEKMGDIAPLCETSVKKSWRCS